MTDTDLLKGKSILIVDDEEDILESLTDLLEMCQVDIAPNFETAEKFLSKNRYDAAIFDIMGVDGYKLLEIANQKDIPALMLTAHAMTPDNLIKSIKRGAGAYVPKDKMVDIEDFLSDLIKAKQAGRHKDGAWFSRLKPFFDRKFGEGWREKDRAFWRDFDKTHLVSKEELEKLL
jgi:DNA-binding NtrC family response regulator